MPLYQYKATNQNHEIQIGTLSASSQDELAQILKRQTLSPISIKLVESQVKNTGNLPAVEKITFCRYVATMLKSGLSLSEGLSVLKEETKHPLMQQIVNDLLYNIQKGQSLSSVFATYPNAFDKFFITLTKAGEVSGTLADSFKYLEREIKADYSLSQKIKGAMMYPAIVIFAMLVIGFLMIFFIMPQIAKVFLSMTLPLPTITRIIFQTTLNLSQFRYYIIGGTLLSIIGLFVFVKTNTGKKVIIKLISPLPVVKSLLKQMDIARFCRTFSTLIAAAVPITEALQIAIDSLNYPQYVESSKPIPDAVSKGKSLSEAFKTHQVFPPMLTQMIAAGEKSGTIDETLHDLANFYESEVEEAIKNATQLLEPALMLLVGIGVGGMILSVIAPLYSVVGSLQQGI